MNNIFIKTANRLFIISIFKYVLNKNCYIIFKKNIKFSNIIIYIK